MKRHPVSIRVLVATVAVIPAMVMAVMLLGLAMLTSREVRERLETSMFGSATTQVKTDVERFLGDAMRVSDLFARRMESGVLPATGLRAWERYEIDELAVTPGIASISFGSATGETTWVLRRSHGLELGRVTTEGEATEYAVDAATATVASTPSRTYRYDPRTRPWYRAALEAGGPVWTPIYFWFGDVGVEAETGTGYVRVVRDDSGGIAGVLVIDVTIGALSAFLKSLPISREGAVFIVDEQGMLVASSAGRVNSVAGQRLRFNEAAHPSARAASAVINDTGALPDGTVRVMVNGVATRVRAARLTPFPGIDWTVVATVPEAVFVGRTQALQSRAFAVSAGMIVAAMVLGLLLSGRLSKPIVALAEHVRRVGRGEYDARLHLRGARELGVLSDEVNRMAGGLKERMELSQALAVAEEVQQSLLPRKSPSRPGLDIAGMSQYCESTGGDYYDFIEMGRSGRLLVAAGDVMGHGIGSALLMATARGALRSGLGPETGERVDLGALLGRVNRVLSLDTSEGRFMTLVLVVIDVPGRRMRWASAGHGAPMVFDAAAGRFAELPGGGIPLGVDADANYEEQVVEGLSVGTTVVLGTDGIWEAADVSGAMFGAARFRQVVQDNASRSSAEILRAIDSALQRFRGDVAAKDDVTAVVIRFVGDRRV